MTNETPNKQLAATVGSTVDVEYEEEKKTKKFIRPPKEGSTHLHPWPSIHLPRPKTARGRDMNFADVPVLRQEMQERIFRLMMRNKNADNYRRSTQDFWRMELDGLNKCGEVNRKHMINTIRVYLGGQNDGSMKAVQELIPVIVESSGVK